MSTYRFDAQDKVDLRKIPTREDGGYEQEEGEARFQKLADELFELQELLYSANDHSVLVVLQGRDTAGKDGTLKSVAGAMNPVGVRIAPFKVPTPLELSHDFLWRMHQQTPGIGEIVFFNRSHYEDVLVVRVHNLIAEKMWRKRYDHINAFEDLLADSGVILVKFFLHISYEEQEKRLLAREVEPGKAWKLNPGDWEERKYWDEYTEAYEDAIGKCSTAHAPWYVIPSDKKWYRNLAIAEALIDELKPYKDGWLQKMERLGAEKRAALDTVRATPRTSG